MIMLSKASPPLEGAVVSLMLLGEGTSDFLIRYKGISGKQLIMAEQEQKV